MFTLEGPAADQYVAILRQHSGVPLTLSARPVAVDPSLPDRRGGRLVEIGASAVPDNPYCSRTLQELIREIASPGGRHVHVRAVMDGPNVFIDAFSGGGLAPRTVSVADLVALGRSRAPEMAAAMIAHPLAEYLHAAGSRRLMPQFANAHVAGLIVEARVVRDLTGRAIFEGSRRPWEEGVVMGNGGNDFRRHYGPRHSYSIVTGPGPAFRIQTAALWTNGHVQPPRRAG
jgi:hypothetical protein